jgi:hypothetical protein
VLTLKQLEDMPVQTKFATGECIDSPEGINMMGSEKMLRWVAVRGGVADWAIYCHFTDHSIEEVAAEGDKVIWEEHIKKLVPCTDEAYLRYRR